MARSTWVAHAFEWEKLFKCHLKGKASKKLANGQNIDYSEKRKCPKGFICPCTGVKYHNIQTCLLVYAADSGERLQDHWSSGYSSISDSCQGCKDHHIILQETDITFLIEKTYMSHLMQKPTIRFQTRSDTNRTVQAQKMARSLKFWI